MTGRRRPTFVPIALAGALLGAGFAAVAVAVVPPAPGGFRLGGEAERGRAVYASTCALCHGFAGDGRGAIRMDPPATDFTDAAAMARRSDWEVYLAIRDGGAALGRSPKMIAWGRTLSDQQIRDVAAYLRTFAAQR